MADDRLVELASRVGGIDGKLGALVEIFSKHQVENREDHHAVMQVLCRMEEKMDDKLDGHDSRIKDLEKFKSYAYGIAAAVTFFISAPHIAQLIIP